MPKFAGCNLPNIAPQTTQSPTKTTNLSTATSLDPTTGSPDITTETSQQTTAVQTNNPSETTEFIIDTTTSTKTEERSTSTMSSITEAPRCPETTDPNIKAYLPHEFLCSK